MNTRLTQEEVNERDIKAGFEILQPAEKYINRNIKRRYKCPRCGKIFETQPVHIWSGNTKSCGCLHPSTTFELKSLYKIDQQEYQKKYRELRGKEAHKKWTQDNYEHLLEYFKKNKKHLYKQRKVRENLLKKEVFRHYCGENIKCQKCGEDNLICLTIDHINGSGSEHRRIISPKNHKGGGGAKTYSWLKRNNYPEGFQVLCMNCQFIKAKLNNEFGVKLKNKKQKEYRDRRRKQVLELYSRGKIKCEKCGQTHIDCLTIDHIHNNGSAHRKEIKGNIVDWLIKNKYPLGFQILCMNCQFIKQFSIPISCNSVKENELKNE